MAGLAYTRCCPDPLIFFRQFKCGLAYNQRSYGYALSGLRPPLRALNAATGDLLCFEPAGHGTATISLRKAGAQAAAAAGSNGAAEEAAAAASAEGRKGQAAAEITGQQKALQELFDD